ncbi:MAG: ABC-F family ATP-binding cassette domain-containing protein [Bacteroidetes bacterium]|nr:ABC-F family ATP-binding cassette domain-containing protein [Bacteroidota bacterium]
MLSLQSVAYAHPNKDILFSDIDLVVNRHEKLALIGNNGVGKSTLLRLLAGELRPSSGVVLADPKPYYVPQIAGHREGNQQWQPGSEGFEKVGQANSQTVAQALGIDRQLDALHRILAGEVTGENLRLLDDDWALEERCNEAFSLWGIGGVDLSQPMSSLSGGQKTKVLLAGIAIHDAATVLLDEPSNHLDESGRELLYRYIRSTRNTLVVVSHDRTLLDLLGRVAELSRRGITVYGGSYGNYVEQRGIASEALNQDIKSQEKALRKARETEREAMQRQQKLDARGRKKQEKAGLPTISMDSFRDNAEKSTARMKGVHSEKTGSIEERLDELRKELPDKDRMRLGFDDPALHTGKVLVALNEVNFGYGGRLLWQQPLSLSILSGQRLAIKGANGSGKTTLIRMILGELQPSSGRADRAVFSSMYIDQDYSLIDQTLTVAEQAQAFNTSGLLEHEIKNRLTRFLFGSGHWDRHCGALSGGEKMRLCLCCLTIAAQSPDMIVLDEPTNNLDIQNIEILTAAVDAYRGTLVVVSHDERFLKEVGVEEVFVPGG